MDKTILKEYIDACELIKETEADIKRLKKKKDDIITDKVKGSMSEFPYAAKNFCIEGMVPFDSAELRREEKLLIKQKSNAEGLKNDIEECMLQAPSRIQRIIRLKIFNNASWESVANRMGRGATGDSVRMEFNRFFENN